MARPELETRIEPLTAETWERFVSDFSRVPSLHWCWCQWWRMRARDFSAMKVPQLREALHDQARGDEPPGLVALDGERALGWVSLAPRERFERLERSRKIPRLDDAPVWSIVCFAVSSSARGRGVSRALLDAAIDYAAERGATIVEAYPADVPDGDRIHPDAAFGGTRSLFEAAGFDVVASTDATVGGVPRVVVRRALADRRLGA